MRIQTDFSNNEKISIESGICRCKTNRKKERFERKWKKGRKLRFIHFTSLSKCLCGGVEKTIIGVLNPREDPKLNENAFSMFDDLEIFFSLSLSLFTFTFFFCILKWLNFLVSQIFFSLCKMLNKGLLLFPRVALVVEHIENPK